MSAARRMCWILPALALSGAACWHSPAPQPFAIERVYPALGADAEPLMLNDAATVYFSAPVDPLSVTSDSVSVVDAAGHPVSGTLKVGRAWVTFEPRPPLQPTLDDGSFKPDTEYRLVVAGYPRPDGVRAADGRHLFEGMQRTFRTAPRVMEGELPAPLRPNYSTLLPLVVKPIEGDIQVPVDDPRLQLHFTLPILPTSLTPEAFALTLVRLGGAEPIKHRVVPRAVRLLPRVEPIDDYPSCTVEIELARRLALLDGSGTVELKADDFIGLAVVAGAKALRDYSGRFHQEPPAERTWYMVPGSAVAVAEWPDFAEQKAARQLLSGSVLGNPGFEVDEQGDLRPLVRLEAGNGEFGVFRPTRDTVLVPGEPFDRGDGVVLRSQGHTFPFMAIDIPDGVTVRVDARAGPVRLLAVDRAQIAGKLQIDGRGRGLRSTDRQVDVSLVMDGSAVTLMAPGGIAITGEVTAEGDAEGSALALITGGRLELGPVPAGTILATEPGCKVVGALDPSCRSVQLQLTPGLPAAAQIEAVGVADYLPLPPGIAGGTLRLDACDPAIRVSWQATLPDAVEVQRPDRRSARSTPWYEFRDGEVIDGLAGQFVRIRCQALLQGGQPLPRLTGVRLLSRQRTGR